MPEQMLALSRRDVLRAGLGGALLLGVHFATSRVASAQEVSDGVFAPDAFIRIDSSGATTLIMPQVEMGQGIYTALTMLIAEELDLDMETVRLEAAPPSDALYGNPIFQIQATGGSTSVRAFWVPLRTAGATARAMLIAAAAQTVGRRCVDLQHRCRQGGPCGERPFGALWRTRRRGGAGDPARNGRLETTFGLPADRQDATPPGYSRQGQRQPEIRHRRDAGRTELRHARFVTRSGRQGRFDR